MCVTSNEHYSVERVAHSRIVVFASNVLQQQIICSDNK